MKQFTYGTATLAALALTSSFAQAQNATDRRDEDRPLGEVVIVAPYGTGIDIVKVPGRVQTATAEQIDQAQALDLTDFLNRQLGSVNINHAQNNPLQPDVNFRGFTASPLLGLSPGMTVYQNGVRINEPFGDTVSWDLIPLSAINSLQLLAGTNPVFGLNTLGGALSVSMKNGFNYEGTQAEVYGGSFDRRGGVLQIGGNNGTWGWYGNVDYFEEDGWRDFSQSDALRFFGALSLRGTDYALDLSAAYADTSLRGNGASPAELLAIDRDQVFTHPDITENRLTQFILEGSRNLTQNVRFSANAYFRDIDTDTFNGDGTIFEECEFGDDEFLVEEEFIDLNGDGECSADDDANIELVRDLSGNPVEAEIDGIEQNAINNIGGRKQESFGFSAQLGVTGKLLGLDNNFTFGLAYTNGDTDYNSNVEIAALQEDRSTSRTGIFTEEFLTGVTTEVETSSAYLANITELTSRLSMIIAGRYDDTRIRLQDQTGNVPDLNGRHSYSRFNPAIGFTYQLTPATLYASYSESMRAPTAVELACASEDAPCNLPNAFLADPPLDEVVAKSFELGVRGTTPFGLRWHVGGFHTTNNDDILFQTTGGAQANVGFFANVGDTRRQGLELSLAQRIANNFEWFAEYSLIDATFEQDFIVNSPNHPVFDDNPGAAAIAGDGKLLVASGAKIPGIPRHQANAGFNFALNDRASVGADVAYRSGVYLRGDEVNLLGRTDSYAILNLRGTYRWNDQVMLFARIENVFDEDYETFGLLGEPDEVFEDFSDPRFYGAGPPLGAWLGVRVNF